VPQVRLTPRSLQDIRSRSRDVCSMAVWKRIDTVSPLIRNMSSNYVLLLKAPAALLVACSFRTATPCSTSSASFIALWSAICLFVHYYCIEKPRYTAQSSNYVRRVWSHPVFFLYLGSCTSLADCPPQFCSTFRRRPGGHESLLGSSPVAELGVPFPTPLPSRRSPIRATLVSYSD
jgi:hypothetical protein